MTIQETHNENIGQEKLKRLSKTGHTYGLDYMIGNLTFFGKGYGSQTLSDFIDYFRELVAPKADTFLIDPASDAPKAKHVYMKAGFKHESDFMMEGDVSGAGKIHHLLLRKFDP
ncbi:MAG: GNAT family N-acetyltransferase [Gammaproteobacteria bacterium]